MAEKLEDRINRAQSEASAATEKMSKLQGEIKKLMEQQDVLSTKISAKHKKQAEDVQKQLDAAIKQFKVVKDIANTEEARVKHLTNYEKQRKKQDESMESFQMHYEQINPLILKQIEGEKAKADIYNELGVQIAHLEGLAEVAGGKDKARLEAEIAQLTNITTEIEEQAKAYVDAQLKAKGLTEIETKIAYAKAKQAHNQSETNKISLEGLEIAEALEKKQERLALLQEQSAEVLEEMPESIQGMVNGIKKFGTILKAAAPELLILGALALAVESFLELDSAAEEYRKTGGMTVKQTEHLAHQAHEIEIAYRGIGVEAKTVFDIANDLGNSFSDVAHFSTETLGALSAVVARTGTSTENAAKLQAIFEQTAGLSEETAASMQMQVASLSQQVGVSPKEVLDDMADSAAITSKFFKGDVKLLAQQAIEAHKMGTSLEKMASTAEKLLDFESGIEDELTAATFVGGQFNLSRARALAMEGKMAQATSETLDQIQRSGDFSKQDYFTQTQLAKAAGMSVEEITKQLGMREKLSHLSEEERKKTQDAIDAGLDISKIKGEDLAKKTKEFAEQQKINGAVSEMSNQFKAITATIGGELMPIIQSLVPVIMAMFKPVEWAITGFQLVAKYMKYLIPIGAILGVMFAEQLGVKIGIAIASIMATFAEYPFGLGIPVGLAVIGGLYSAISGAKSKAAGDINSPAKGQTMVHTKEGGLFKLSKNDDLVAAPGASKAMANGNSSTPLASNNNANSSNMMSAFIGELRGLRGDMNSGKIGVYMDGSKVTSNVAGNANQSTRNNYAFT